MTHTRCQMCGIPSRKHQRGNGHGVDLLPGVSDGNKLEAVRRLVHRVTLRDGDAGDTENDPDAEENERLDPS